MNEWRDSLVRMCGVTEDSGGNSLLINGGRSTKQYSTLETMAMAMYLRSPPAFVVIIIVLKRRRDYLGMSCLF
jgi:hypothetical protein